MEEERLREEREAAEASINIFSPEQLQDTDFEEDITHCDSGDREMQTEMVESVTFFRLREERRRGIEE